MESAFGIDHGYEEIEKANPFAALGTKLASGTMKAGQGLRGRGAGVLKQVRTSPHPSSPGFNTGANKIGAGYVKAGGAIRGLGQKMAAHPGLTGGVAAGGGAAGIGAVGGAIGNRRRY